MPILTTSVIATPERKVLATIAEAIKAARVKSVAICLLNSYANPANERAVAEVLRGLESVHSGTAPDAMKITGKLWLTKEEWLRSIGPIWRGARRNNGQGTPKPPPPGTRTDTTWTA